MDEKKQELLEIYKLHADLADRVSQRRDSANRLYVGLLTGIILLTGISLLIGMLFAPRSFRWFTEGAGADLTLTWIVPIISSLGIILSVSWFVVIRSYRQLNTGKFKMLHELEDKIAYPAFRREWEILEQGENKNKYWKLTKVETFLPIVFGLFFIIWPFLYYLLNKMYI